jgi:ferrous iron transport protein A
MTARIKRPLCDVAAGQTATVVGLEGGREFRNRLVSMGMMMGCTLRVIRAGNGSGHPVLVALGHARLAIGRGMAEKVLVRPDSVARRHEGVKAAT